MQKKRIYQRLYKIFLWFFGIITGLFLLISFLLWMYKDEICQMAIDELNQNLKAEVTVSDVELTFWSTFPNLSIDFNHVFVKDAVPGATDRDTLLYSDQVRFKLNPFDIWAEEYKVKSVEVKPGVLKLKVDEHGNNNYDILKEPEEKSESDGFDFRLEKVSFDNFRFSYTNAATAQEYSTRINDMDLEGEFTKSVFTTKAKADLQIVSAKSGNITLVSNKPAKLEIKVDVNTDSNTVIIPKSTIHVAELPFHFLGNVGKEDYSFDLTGKDIPIKDAANNLAMEQTKDIKKFSGTGTLLFELNIDGKLDAKSPTEVECDFGVKQGTLKDPNSGITLTDLSLEGKYSNIGGPEEEYLKLKDIGFKTRGGPFRGNLLLTNFASPHFKGNMDGLLNLSVVRSLFKLTSLQRLNGTVDISSRFEVQAEPLPDETFNYRIDRCEGQMRLNKVNAQLVDDKRIYRNINGLVYLRNDRVGMEDITLKVGRSDFKLDGTFKRVVDYFGNRGSLVADVHMESQYIDLADLGSDTKEDKMMHAREFILPDDIEGDVYLDVGKMRYEKHMFYNLKGNMNLINRKIHFPRISVTNGGADVRGSLTIHEGKPEIFYISTQIVSNNINFSKLFKEWDNFEQDVIKSSNISGDAQANVRFEAPFDLRNGIIMNAIEAQVGIQVDNGRLKGVQSFKEITKSLKATTSARIAIGKENIDEFERKLLDLRFKQLKNTLLIRDGVITIPTMSIESSALDIEMSGKHTFKNIIDYRFGFRFRDLKKEEVNEFGKVIDDGTGKYVFMRMYGDLYNPSFEWDKVQNKEHKKEMREIAKQDAKSALKAGFGLFKNDTTVKDYIEVRRPHEELIINENPVDEIDELMEKKKPKKELKMFKGLNKIIQEGKKEQEAKKEKEFDFD